MNLFEIWFYQGICPVLGFLNHTVVLFLAFWRTSIMLSRVAVSITFMQTVQKGFFCSIFQELIFDFLLTISLRRGGGLKIVFPDFYPSSTFSKRRVISVLIFVFIGSVMASVHDEYFLFARLISLQWGTLGWWRLSPLFIFRCLPLGPQLLQDVL